MPEVNIGEYTSIQNGLFVLFLVCFFITVFSVSREGALIKIMTEDLFRNKDNKSIFSEPITNASLNKSLMSFQAILLYAIILFSIFNYSVASTDLTFSQSLLSTTGLFIGIIVFLLYKLTTTNIIGNIFFRKEQVQHWNSIFFSVISISGLILFIPTVLLVFTDYFLVFIGIVAICFLFFSGLLVYKTFSIFFQKKYTLLYFILYLCAQEIIPLYLLYKGLSYTFILVQKETLWTAI